MNKIPYEPITIDLVDLFAFLVRKIGLILLVCILGSAAFLGIHFRNANTEKYREEYEKKLRLYNNNVETCENNIMVLESKRLALRNSMNEDPATKFVEAQTVYCCNTSFLLSADNDVLVSESGKLVYPNQESLISFFNTIDLHNLLETEVKNEYLRKLVVVSALNNSISLNVYNQDKETALKWADLVKKELIRFATVENDWEVKSISTNAQVYYGDAIIRIVENYNNEISKIDKEILKQSEELEKTLNDTPRYYQIVKNMILGFLIGGVFEAIILTILFMKRNLVTKSIIAEKKVGKPLLGTVFPPKKYFDTLSRRIIGERTYQSAEEEIEFLRSSIRNADPVKDKKTKSITILCSCDGKYVRTQAELLESVISEFDISSVLIANAPTNPIALESISKSDAVIILEKQWVSQWGLVGIGIEMAERCNRQLMGIVLC